MSVLLLLLVPLVQSESVCTGRGDSTRDWLVAGCSDGSNFSSSSVSDGNVVYTLSNGIITRELTHFATTNTLSTTAIRMTANQTTANLVTTVVPEASLMINGMQVQVGGVAGQIKGSRITTYRSVRSGMSAVAGGYTWIPGVRGSNPNAAWPPRGSRVEFDHVLLCGAVVADGADNEWITFTVHYEQYDGTSGFSRGVAVLHNCSSASLFIANINVAYLALVNDGHVEFQSDTDASLTKSTLLTDGTRSKVQTSYDTTEQGMNLTAGQSYQSYLVAEIFHSTFQWDQDALGGVDRYARESARFWRLVTPQIEQMVVYVQGICVGGNKKYPEDGSDGSVGYWCYDDEGTQGMQVLIDQTKEMKTDMLVFGQNMNQSWRSMVGPEFNSQANLTWFSKLVARAHNTSDGQHSVEVGVYQLLLNARSASALNQVAPGNAFALPNHWFDAMDPHSSLPDHNQDKDTCKGGPSCASLCAGTSFYQNMKTSMLEFWKTVRLSAIDQDGSRYMPCANASHAHHGHNDSMRVQFEEVKDLFHTYLDIPSGFPSGDGVPKVAFVTSASANFLEAGQAKVPGGYNEDVWSLPRWHWIDLQRVLIIKGVNALVNVQRYYPVPLSMPYHNVQFNPADKYHWASCYGYLTNATLTPLEEHLPELNWVLSQTFGTGVMAQLRSRYLYDGPQSKTLLQWWISWFRKYQGILSQDFVTLSLTTSCINETQPTMQCSLDPSIGIDAIIHHGSPAIRSDFSERAMVMVWNPAQVAFNGTLTASLYYSGLTHAAGVSTVSVSYEGGTPKHVPLSTANSVDLFIQLRPRSLTWIVIGDTSVGQ
eukprot:m.69130 g.69130  ORF g.69130 m.69130 type:complete len:822 (-) comp24054_c0_seq2:107-2572(-)